MKEIQLTQDKMAIVDDEDFEWLSKYKWHYQNKGYAERNRSIHLGKHKTILMHREILQVPDGMESDHINGNRLDNRRANLRICTRGENGKNLRKHVDNTSGFKGVSWHKRAKKWIAQITINYKYVYLGLFDDKQVAACAYDKATCKLHREFACTNFQSVEEND